MRLKNLLITALLICPCCLMFSQTEQPDFSKKKNVNKVNILFGPFYKMVHVSYEKPIGKRFSINTTVKARPASLTRLSKLGVIKTDGATYNPFPEMKLSALGNITEFRIYSKKKGPLKGFYFGPYLSGVFYKLQSPAVPVTFKDDNGVEFKGDVSTVVKLNFIGGGLQMGVQGMIKDIFVIDWNILGVGFASVGLKGGIEATNTSANFDFRNYTKDVDGFTYGVENLLPITKTVDKEKVELGVRGFAPIIKTGLYIGIAY